MIHDCGNAMKIEKRNFICAAGHVPYVLSLTRFKGYSSFAKIDIIKRV